MSIENRESAPTAPEEGVDGIRHALTEMVKIAAPAVVTMLSYTVMQFVDLLIVSQLGAKAMSAVGNGTIIAFLPAAAMFGVMGVISTFVSQNLGAGRPERGSAYAWNGLWINFGVWVVLLLPFAVVLPDVQELMRGLLRLEIDSEVRDLETSYGRIALAGMIFTISARSMAHFFFGVHRPLIVMVAAIIGNGINIPITMALVTGQWGAPDMGVTGAAIGTVIGSFVEFALLMLVFLSPRFDDRFATRRAWKPSRACMIDIWRIGWPAGLMIGSEIMCWWIFMSGFIAHFGPAHNTAGFIVLRYMHLSFMPAVGLSMAVTAVVGKSIGAGRPDQAARRAKLGMALGMAYMGACALAMVVFREEAVRLFVEAVPSAADVGADIVPQVIEIGATVLIIAAAFQVFDALAIILVGALRGAGDTLWPGVATVILSWTLIVGMGWIMKEAAPGLESVGPWLGAAAYIIVLSIAMVFRYLSGAWRKIDLLHQPPAERFIAMDAGEGVVPELPMADTNPSSTSLPLDGSALPDGAPHAGSEGVSEGQAPRD